VRALLSSTQQETNLLRRRVKKNRKREEKREALATPHQGWCGELPTPVTAIALGPAYTPLPAYTYLASMLTPALRVGEPDPQAPWTAPV